MYVCMYVCMSVFIYNHQLHEHKRANDQLQETVHRLQSEVQRLTAEKEALSRDFTQRLADMSRPMPPSNAKPNKAPSAAKQMRIKPKSGILNDEGDEGSMASSSFFLTS